MRLCRGLGIEHWFEYFQHVAAFPQMAVNGSEVNEMIDFINRSGIGVTLRVRLS